MKQILLFLLIITASTYSFANCTRAKLAGEYSGSGVVPADAEFDTVYITGRFTLNQGGGLRVPLVIVTGSGERITGNGSGGWGVNNNCVGFMNVNIRIQGVTGDARIDFTAAGSGNDVVLSAVYTDDDADESGTFIFRKQNL